MAKMGRPPKPPSDRRTERLEIRLTVQERNGMQAAADAADIPLSEWLRLAALRQLVAE